MNLASLIDHTLLKPDATIHQIEKLCQEAREYGFYAVCLNPYWLSTARKFLEGSPVKICTVAGFPLGANLPQSKAHEARIATDAGADEIDMVINLAAALEAHWNFVEHEIHEVVSASHGKTVKVIIETSLLNDDHIRQACQCAVRAGAQFVKTSTGFSSGGATVANVKLIRSCLPDNVGVKASGGIRNLKDALELIEAGANRLGTSAGVSLVTSKA